MLCFTSKRREVCVYIQHLHFQLNHAAMRLQAMAKNSHFAITTTMTARHKSSEKKKNCRQIATFDYNEALFHSLNHIEWYSSLFAPAEMAKTWQCICLNWKKQAHNNVVFDSSSYSHMDGTYGWLLRKKNCNTQAEWKRTNVKEKENLNIRNKNKAKKL